MQSRWFGIISNARRHKGRGRRQELTPVSVCVCVPGEHCSEAPVNIWPMCQWLVGEVPQDITLENVLACSRQQQCGDRVCVCVCERPLYSVCVNICDYICDLSVRDDCIICVWGSPLCLNELKMIVFLWLCVNGDCSALVRKIVYFVRVCWEL